MWDVRKASSLPRLLGRSWLCVATRVAQVPPMDTQRFLFNFLVLSASFLFLAPSSIPPLGGCVRVWLLFYSNERGVVLDSSFSTPVAVFFFFFRVDFSSAISAAYACGLPVVWRHAFCEHVAVVSSGGVIGIGRHTLRERNADVWGELKYPRMVGRL